MNQARSVAAFLTKNLRYPNGKPVECVVADTCIGGVGEAAATAEKFARASGGFADGDAKLVLWLETMDMDPHTPKAVWGFNGTERPARSTWPPCSPPTVRRGPPGIYGRDVQDLDDASIPADVAQAAPLRQGRDGRR